MDGFPTAFYLAPLEDVLNNPYVMFRLVRPTPPTPLQKAGGVESAAGLVNVIPQRRIYRMETVNEIEIFKRELLKRPLVLQSISHSGLGCGSGGLGCGISTVDRNWVLLINQTHPKVLGRLQMGADAAKGAMQKGHPFVLRFRFGTLLQRLHMELFQNDVNFTPAMQYTEWEYAELVVRFPGKVRDHKMNPASALMAPTCRELNFDFADILLEEIKQVVNNQRMVLRGPIDPITEDEIRDLLPGWTVNEITPLDNIGEERPETYSYAQAGRLYESFRKKKRQRPKASDSSESGEPSGRHVGTRMRGLTGGPPGDEIELDDVKTSFDDDGGFGAEGARRNVPQTSQIPVKPERKSRVNRNPVESRGDYSDGSHVYPDITIVDRQRDRNSSSDSRDYYQPNRALGTAKPFDQIPHRDSDRSSRSTGESSVAGADSGYSGDDGYGGYYGNRRYDDYSNTGYDNDRKRMPSAHYDPMDEKYGHTTTQRAQENLGFHDDDHRQDDILRKHKEYVAKMVKSHVGKDYSNKDTRDYHDEGYSPRGDNYDQNYKPRNGHVSNGRDYYDQSRSRAYSGYDEAPPPSYGDVTSPTGQSKFRLQGDEAMAESFI